MKITIDVQGAPVEITLTPEQLAQIEEQNKPKQFKWSYPSCYFLEYDHIFECPPNGLNEYIEHGRYRKTKETAEQSLARNKRANRLEALAEQLDGLREWKENYPISYIRYINGKWEVCTGTSWFCPERVYMTEECAEEICHMLNEGEFSLDGELE